MKKPKTSLLVVAAAAGLLAGSLTAGGCSNDADKQKTESNGCGGPNGCGAAKDKKDEKNSCSGHNGCGAEKKKEGEKNGCSGANGCNGHPKK